MVKIAYLDDAFSEWFELEASPVEVKSLQQKEKKRRKRGGEKNKIKKPEDVFDCCTCASKNVVKCSASVEKAMLSFCKCLFE